MKKIFLVGVFLAMFFVGSVNAQGMRDVRINEVMVNNTNGLSDNYGEKISWIELHNVGFSNVDVSGSYITPVKGNPKAGYKIPKHPGNVIPPKGYLVIYLDGNSNKSLWHANFKLESGFLGLYDSSGKGEPYSEVTYNTSIPENVSIGYEVSTNGEPEVFGTLDHVTPNAPNEKVEAIARHVVFLDRDPIGIGMAICAMSVVFSALILLYIIFRSLGKSMVRMANKKNSAATASAPVASKAKVVESSDLSGEEVVAIATAIRLYMTDLHDIESTVITINKVARAYSPWSSKIYGLRQIPNRIQTKK